MISAVDLLKGIAVGADMDRIIVEGANREDCILIMRAKQMRQSTHC